MIKTLLDKEIVAQLENLGNLELGSEEHATAIAALDKLLEKSIKIDQNEVTREDKLAVDTEELNLKEEQIKMAKRQAKTDKWIRIGQIAATVTCTGLSLLVTIWGTNKWSEYEEEHVMDKSVARSFENRLFK